MKFIPLLLVCLSVLALEPVPPIRGKVVAVTDGDTVKVLVANRVVTVRLWGIDAPEKNQAYGAQAKTALSELVFGKVIEVETFGQDKYRRTLGRLYVGEGADRVDVNRHMVETGFAWWYEKYAPTAVDLQKAQEAAKEGKLGLWAENNPMPPWAWRKR